MFLFHFVSKFVQTTFAIHMYASVQMDVSYYSDLIVHLPALATGGGCRKSLNVLKVEVKVIFSVFLVIFVLIYA